MTTNLLKDGVKSNRVSRSVSEARAVIAFSRNGTCLNKGKSID